MLKNAITLWPEERWATDKRFFYTAYHCLVFLDYYLTIPAQNMSSPLPFTFVPDSEIPAGALDDIVPDRIYTKAELLAWLQSCREKCHTVVTGLTEAQLQERWIETNGGRTFPVLELLLYNMRHVQHHAGQLGMMLRQAINDAPRWVSRAGNNNT
jgi:hypothetical protein